MTSVPMLPTQINDRWSLLLPEHRRGRLECSVAECSKPVRARGLCSSHWNRWRRYGDPTEVRAIQGDDRARLLAKIERGDGCWTWLGSFNANGYGRAFLNGRRTYAHRAVYEVLVGPIPPGLDLDHECHNRDRECCGGWSCAHRSCVNPAHLIPRARGENSRLGRYERVR